MKKGPLSAEPAEQSQGSSRGRSREGRSHGRGRATRDTPSAIRLLGTDNSSGTKCQSKGASPRPDLPLAGGASGAHPLELRAGLRMESIDDDWDIEKPAATAVPAVSHAPAGSNAERPASANPASPVASTASQSLDPGQLGSPSGLAFPAVSAPATVPSPEPGQKSNPSVVPAQKAAPAAVSKVQLAAEAFRRKAGISATPSTAPSAKPTASAAIKIAAEKAAPNPAAAAKPVAPAPAPVASTPAFPNVVSPTVSTSVDAPTAEPAPAAEPTASTVVVSPVVALEEPLELVQEIVPSVPPPPLPEEALAEAAMQPIPAVEPIPTIEPKAQTPKTEAPVVTDVAPADASKADTPKAEAPSTKLPKAEQKRESSSMVAAQARKDSEKTKTAARAPQESHLSLDTDYALEFFSSPPPPVHVEAPIDRDYVIVEQRGDRTPELIARQQYLRGLVVKVMLVAIVFVAGIIFLLWRRGLLHFTPYQ